MKLYIAINIYRYKYICRSFTMSCDRKRELFLSPGQIKSLASAVKNGNSVSMKLSKESLKKSPNTDIMITKTQEARVDKALRDNKGLVIKMSKTQALANRKALRGGILPLLASIGIPLITGLLTNILS